MFLSCFFPIPQAAECILRIVEKANAPVIYLSTDAAESETNFLQSLVVFNDKQVPLVKRPEDALLYRNHMGGDNQVLRMTLDTIFSYEPNFESDSEAQDTAASPATPTPSVAGSPTPPPVAGPATVHPTSVQNFIEGLKLPLDKPFIQSPPRLRVSCVPVAHLVPRRSDRLAAKSVYRDPQPEKQAKRVMPNKWQPSSSAPRLSLVTSDAAIAARFPTRSRSRCLHSSAWQCRNSSSWLVLAGGGRRRRRLDRLPQRRKLFSRTFSFLVSYNSVCSTA